MPSSDRQTILIVDDMPENIDVLRGILKGTYALKVATNGERALKIARTIPPPDLSLLDSMTPGMSGFEVCEALQREAQTRAIPVIFVTARSEVSDEQAGFEVGAVDYITKPVSAPIVETRVRTHLALYDQKRHLSDLVDERTLQLRESRLHIIRTLGRAAEFNDEDTGLHVVRMSRFSQLIAQANGLNDETCELLLNAAPMHDVGKIGIPDSILQKPGRLDDDELAIMRRHAGMGAEIIGDYADNNPLLEMAHTVAATRSVTLSTGQRHVKDSDQPRGLSSS